MTRILILILTFYFSLTAKADLPGPAYQYYRYSENGTFYFKSIPFYNYDLTNFGKTVVYSSKDNKELYSIDHYLPTEAFISNNGKSLVTTTYWMWGHTNFEDQILINIFLNGQDSIHYRIDDLVSDKSILQNTSSHTLWYDKMFVVNDTLHVFTLEEKVVRISLVTGGIIDKLNKTDCLICKNIDELIEPKTIYYTDINYPKGYIFPDLIDGKGFRESLILGLNKTEVKQYTDCKYYIMIYGTIDRTGNCEVFFLRANVDEIENEEWKKEVSTWVISQKYKTDLIPENCDKWVFQEYFYLK